MGRKRATSEGFDYKTYYEDNKDAIAERRRKKYREDAEHRRKANKAALERYYDKKDDTPRDRKMLSDGATQYLTIGKVAELIGRKVQTVREYHTSNVIPAALFYDNRGWRLYTVGQALLLRDTFKKFDDKKLKTLSNVSEILHDRWEKASKIKGGTELG